MKNKTYSHLWGAGGKAEPDSTMRRGSWVKNNLGGINRVGKHPTGRVNSGPDRQWDWYFKMREEAV